MAAEYDFFRKPNPKGDGELQPLYPRIVSKGTIDSKQLTNDISTMSSFTPGDIEGLLTAFEERISYYLSEGYHVQLGDIGYFSAKLKARPVMDRKDIHSQSILFDTINFRATRHFRQYCAGNVVRSTIGFNASSNLTGGERYARLKSYLVENPFITLRTYSSLTGLLKGKASKDLHLLVEKGYLTTTGRGSHLVYLLPKHKEVMTQNEPIESAE